MNHRLCPRRTLAWALLKVYGTPEATELIKEQEKIAFPLSFESRQYSNSYFCPTIEKVDVRIKEKFLSTKRSTKSADFHRWYCI